MIDSRGNRANRWIMANCVHGFGRERGKRASLAVPEAVMIARAYDSCDLSVLPASGQLAAWLALLHIAGPKASSPAPSQVQVDLWSILRSAAPRLRSSLRRQGETVVFIERRREDRRV